jgi:hypothetical protein
MPGPFFLSMTSPPATSTAADLSLLDDILEELHAQPPALEEPAEQQDDLFRTKRDGVFKLHECFFGAYLAHTDDPQANAEIAKDDLKRFVLHPDYSRIPAELWSAWIKLCFEICGKTTAEVSIRLLQRIGDRTQWRAVVPLQVVSGAAVRTGNFSDSIDLITGEVLTSYPPEGWMAVGSSHSHSTMEAFFSGTDDQYELNDPGVHIVVGRISIAANTYHPLASITNQKRRFILPFGDIIDVTPITGATFHPDVLGYIFDGDDANTAAVEAIVDAEQARNEWPKKYDYRTPSQLNAGNGYSRNRYGWDYDYASSNRRDNSLLFSPEELIDEGCRLLYEVIPEASAFQLMDMRSKLNHLLRDVNDILSDDPTASQDRASAEAHPGDLVDY